MDCAYFNNFQATASIAGGAICMLKRRQLEAAMQKLYCNSGTVRNQRAHVLHTVASSASLTAMHCLLKDRVRCYHWRWCIEHRSPRGQRAALLGEEPLEVFLAAHSNTVSASRASVPHVPHRLVMCAPELIPWQGPKKPARRFPSSCNCQCSFASLQGAGAHRGRCVVLLVLSW